MIKYRELLTKLQCMKEEDLNKNITIYNKTEDEYFSISELIVSDETCDVVDEGHLLLVFECEYPDPY